MSDVVIRYITEFILKKNNHHLLSLIKGIRNGIVYGVKIRFPHALVMTLLFRGGSWKDKAYGIYNATHIHATNLAKFVFLYKSLTKLLAHIFKGNSQWHSFVAAFIGGYIVFGQFNKVNEQINLYLLSRILYGLAKMCVKRNYIQLPKSPVFPWFAALVWGIVLWQFEYEQDTLQPSLQSSMTYLYHDSEKWSSLKNFLLYNR